jgi:hypothetical protein
LSVTLTVGQRLVKPLTQQPQGVGVWLVTCSARALQGGVRAGGGAGNARGGGPVSHAAAQPSRLRHHRRCGHAGRRHTHDGVLHCAGDGDHRLTASTCSVVCLPCEGACLSCEGACTTADTGSLLTTANGAPPASLHCSCSCRSCSRCSRPSGPVTCSVEAYMTRYTLVPLPLLFYVWCHRSPRRVHPVWCWSD